MLCLGKSTRPCVNSGKTTGGGGVVLPLSDDVMSQLREKHPSPQEARLGSLLFGPVEDVPDSVGSLGNDDGIGNENGKKAIGLDKQNNNFALVSRLFVHFSAVVARLQRETA